MTTATPCPRCGTTGRHWCLRPAGVTSATLNVPAPPVATRAPRRCPVCEGRGTVSRWQGEAICKLCDGAGEVWR